MGYVGLPDGAVVEEPKYAGLPEGAKIVPSSEEATTSGQDSIALADVPGQALRNIPSSALNMAKGIVSPLVHPMDTLEGFGRTIAGAGDLVLGDKTQEAQGVKDIGKFFADRYGGYENLKRTAAKDPVGFLMDLSTVLTGGGSIAAKAPGILGKAGAAVRTAGEVTNPLNATKLVTGPVNAFIKNREIPEKLMEGVMKYPTPMKGTKRHGMVETQFKYGLDPTKKGVIADLQQKVTEMNVESSQLKAIATQNGGLVPMDEIASAVDRVIDKWSISDQPSKYVETLKKYKERLISGNKPALNASELDQFTTNMQSILKPDFQKQLNINPTAKAEVIKEAQTAVHDAAKTRLAELAGIGELNAEQSRLLGLKPHLERASNRIRNWNTVRLTDMLVTLPATAGAYYAGGSTAAIGAAIAARVLTHPGTHAKIAFMLKNGVITAQQAQSLRNASLAIRAANMVSAEDLLGPTK